MKVLYFDIETAPIEAYVWGLYDQNVAVNQIKQDWTVLSWAAKWKGQDKVLYCDNRKAKKVRDDKKLLKGIWELLDEADVVVTQNGKQFDVKKLNSRFAIHGMQPPSSFKHIDTKMIAKKYFGFTSNSLEYMTEALKLKFKKLKHKNFPGFELWREVLKGRKAAWKEMERYNRHDVLALEELCSKLQPWDSSINFNLYNEGTVIRCSCGSTEFRKRGFFFTNVGKFQRYKCKKCGAETRDRENLFSKAKKKSLRVGVVR